MPDQTNQQMLGSSGTIVPSKVYVVVRVKIGPLLPSSSQHFIDASLRCALHAWEKFQDYRHRFPPLPFRLKYLSIVLRLGNVLTVVRFHFFP